MIIDQNDYDAEIDLAFNVCEQHALAKKDFITLLEQTRAQANSRIPLANFANEESLKRVWGGRL